MYFREKETRILDSFVNSSNERALAIYGRRRTGKTELVLDYISKNRGLNLIYYQCAGYDYGMCLNDFKETVLRQFPDLEIMRAFSSFKDVFSYMSAMKPEIKGIIIDEFPFLSKKDNNVPVEFQWIIDHGLKDLKLILLGSDLSFMKHQISDMEAPLYGRFDQMIEILPFTFSELTQLFPDFNDAVNVYAQTGGVAQYVMFFKNYDRVETATSELFFRRNGRLFQEASNLLMQEVRDTGTYINILRAIGGSEKNSGQIAKKLGIDPRGIFPYINKLTDLGILVAVENSLTGKRKERRFRIADNLFRFTYTFLEPNSSMIAALEEKAEAYVLGDSYAEYLGFVYEEIIHSMIYYYAAEQKIPFMPTDIGKWWGNVYHNEKWIESEIDLMAFNSESIILGECKFRNKAAGIGELEWLKEKSAFVPVKGRKVQYLIASKSGFTEELKNMKDVILIEGTECL